MKNNTIPIYTKIISIIKDSHAHLCSTVHHVGPECIGALLVRVEVSTYTQK